ncbi:MAG: hypothetical protein V4670_04140 [Bacteroidota bacterium]
MKNQILSIFAMLSLSINAQDLKVKKGDIFIDDKKVAKIEKKENLVYEVSNLDGTYKAVINHQVCDVTGYAYLVIKNGDNKNQLNYAKFSPFNIEKSIVQSLIKENFISSEGFSPLKINEFLTGPFKDLGKEYGCEDQADESELALRKNVKIQDNGLITIDADNKKSGFIIRKITNSQGGFVEYKYEVLDLKNIKVGSIQNIVSASTSKSNLITIDGKSYLIGLKKLDAFNEKLSQDPNAKNIVLKLLYKGYALGESTETIIAGKNEEVAKERKEKIESEKLNSDNIYGSEGYVILANGEKVTGKINATLQEIKSENSNQPVVYGNSLMITARDGSALEKPFFYAKEKIKFGISSPKERFFESMIVKNQGINLNEYRFYERVYTNEIGGIYLDNNLRYFIIKLNTKEFGLGISTFSKNKVVEKLEEYLTCKVTIDPSKVSEKDYLIELLETIKKTCK